MVDPKEFSQFLKHPPTLPNQKRPHINPREFSRMVREQDSEDDSPDPSNSQQMTRILRDFGSSRKSNFQFIMETKKAYDDTHREEHQQFLDLLNRMFGRTEQPFPSFRDFQNLRVASGYLKDHLRRQVEQRWCEDERFTEEEEEWIQSSHTNSMMEAFYPVIPQLIQKYRLKIPPRLNEEKALRLVGKVLPRLGFSMRLYKKKRKIPMDNAPAVWVEDLIMTLKPLKPNF